MSKVTFLLFNTLVCRPFSLPEFLILLGRPLEGYLVKYGRLSHGSATTPSKTFNKITDVRLNKKKKKKKPTRAKNKRGNDSNKFWSLEMTQAVLTDVASLRKLKSKPAEEDRQKQVDLCNRKPKRLQN